MKKIISVLLLSVMFSASASAEYRTYGYGAQSCGVWVAEKEKNTVSYLGMQGWVAGFVSGVGSSEVVKIKKTDIDAMVLFVNNYCEENPLERVSKAAETLILELME